MAGQEYVNLGTFGDDAPGGVRGLRTREARRFPRRPPRNWDAMAHSARKDWLARQVPGWQSMTGVQRMEWAKQSADSFGAFRAERERAAQAARDANTEQVYQQAHDRNMADNREFTESGGGRIFGSGGQDAEEERQQLAAQGEENRQRLMDEAAAGLHPPGSQGADLLGTAANIAEHHALPRAGVQTDEQKGLAKVPGQVEEALAAGEQARADAEAEANRLRQQPNAPPQPPAANYDEGEYDVEDGKPQVLRDRGGRLLETLRNPVVQKGKLQAANRIWGSGRQAAGDVRPSDQPMFEARKADLQADIDRKNRVQDIMAETDAETAARLANLDNTIKAELSMINEVDARRMELNLRNATAMIRATAGAQVDAQIGVFESGFRLYSDPDSSTELRIKGMRMMGVGLGDIAALGFRDLVSDFVRSLTGGNP